MILSGLHKFILIFFLFGALVCSSGYKKTVYKEKLFKDYFVIWAHSDIQPKDKGERVYYKAAVEDIRDNFYPMKAVILAGDIIQRHVSKDDFEWFLDIRKEIGIDTWYEISGNHDARNFANYFKYIKKPLYYSVSIGNIRMIFLSDEVNNSPTVISDSAFEWWKNDVINNQDKIIFTVTHASLPESGLAFAKVYRSKILKSKRFTDVLKKYRVDVWFSGHTSVPSFSGFAENFVPELNNVLFVNLSSIRRDFGMSVKSRLLLFKENENRLVIKLRDHTDRKFIDKREIRLKLKVPFKLGNGKPEIFYPEGIITLN